MRGATTCWRLYGTESRDVVEAREEGEATDDDVPLESESYELADVAGSSGSDA
ncbi:MAG: hypothetical protein Pars2KO_33290 [Parasphingorhabdus sp.]